MAHGRGHRGPADPEMGVLKWDDGGVGGLGFMKGAVGCGTAQVFLSLRNSVDIGKETDEGNADLHLISREQSDGVWCVFE